MAASKCYDTGWEMANRYLAAPPLPQRHLKGIRMKKMILALMGASLLTLAGCASNPNDPLQYEKRRSTYYRNYLTPWVGKNQEQILAKFGAPFIRRTTTIGAQNLVYRIPSPNGRGVLCEVTFGIVGTIVQQADFNAELVGNVRRQPAQFDENGCF